MFIYKNNIFLKLKKKKDLLYLIVKIEQQKFIIYALLKFNGKYKNIMINMKKH